MNKSNAVALLIVGGAILAAVALIAVGRNNSGVAINSGHGNSNFADNVPDQKLLKSLEGDSPVLGNPDAPVTLVEFGDYQCTFCTRFFKQTEPALIEKYVKTGKLKIVFRDLVVNGRESQKAAEGAACANEQGKFWEYHNRLFNEREGYNVGVFTNENLERFAADLGLDAGRFSECYESGRYRNEIAADRQDANRYGATGTPTFFLNGIRIVGAQPLSVFENAIEQILSQLEAARQGQKATDTL